MDSRTMHIGGLTFSITAIRHDDGGYTTMVVESNCQDSFQDTKAVIRDTRLRHATMAEALDAGQSIIRARIRRTPR